MPDERPLEIRPFEGFGPVDFGASREEVERVLGPAGWESPDGHRLEFPDWGLFVDFDDEGRCEFVEAYFPPCVPMLGELRLWGERWEVEELLAAKGYRLCRGTGVSAAATDCEEIGVAFWGNMGALESVSAWRRGYWEEHGR